MTSWVCAVLANAGTCTSNPDNLSGSLLLCTGRMTSSSKTGQVVDFDANAGKHKVGGGALLSVPAVVLHDRRTK